MSMFKPNKEIHDVDDYNDYASTIFHEFLEGLAGDERFVRRATEDDYEDYGDEITYIYTTRGGRLAERFLDRLERLGSKYFSDEVYIESYLYLI